MICADWLRRAQCRSSVSGSSDIRSFGSSPLLANRVVDVQYGMGHSLLIENWTRYMANKNFLNFQECILGEGSAE